MGYGVYSNDAYNNLQQSRLQSHGVRAFTHTEDVQAGRAVAGTHPRLNPHGLRVRESRDSADHPTSVPIAVFFDVTGSMGEIPRILQRRLSPLMGLLVQRGYVPHPQVLFGAFGDAHGDRAPLQVGQFESDVQMDEDLDKVYVEGHGGGAPDSLQYHEDYGLAYYVAARHTATDAWEKRRKKGYLFVIGDEMPYDVVRRSDLRRLIGDAAAVETDVSISAIVAEAQQRWQVFHLLATQGSAMRAAGPQIEGVWRGLLGDAVLRLDDPEHVAELIALVVGLMEETVDLDRAERDLTEMGISAAAVAALRQTVAPLRGIILRA